jgi:hypothetical protein
VCSLVKHWLALQLDGKRIYGVLYDVLMCDGLYRMALGFWRSIAWDGKS